MTPNDLEKAVIRYFLMSKGLPVESDDSFFQGIYIKNRDLTGVGFFTYLVQSEKLKVGNVGEKYNFSEVGARINNLIDTGYLIYVVDGYLECIEGYTYEEPWPATIDEIIMRQR